MADSKKILLKFSDENRSEIIVDVKIAVPLKSIYGSPSIIEVKTKALIDTGANMSCVSSRIAMGCHLASNKVMKMISAQGMNVVPVYKIDLELPNGLIFQNTQVLEIACGRKFDVIIGMDILSKCDFIVSNTETETFFALRFPSENKCLDFENL